MALRAVRTLGLRDGIAFPQLIVADGQALVVEVAARIPGGQMADLAFHALGIDLVEIALRQALGEEVPDELVIPRQSLPTAIRFLTAQPGPLPVGKVTKISGLDRVLKPGSRAGRRLPAGGRDDPAGAARRRPARLRDRDRPDERAGAGAGRGGGAAAVRGDRMKPSTQDVGKGMTEPVALTIPTKGLSCAFDLEHYRSCSTRRRPAATATPSSTASRRRARSCCATTSTSPSARPSRSRSWRRRPAHRPRTS